MNNCGCGRRKSLSFRFHEIATQARNDKVFGLRPKRKPIRSVLINGMCNFEDVTKPPTASLWSGLLTFTHLRGTYSRNVLIRSERSQGGRRDKRRAWRLYKWASACCSLHLRTSGITRARYFSMRVPTFPLRAMFTQKEKVLCPRSRGKPEGKG